MVNECARCGKTVYALEELKCLDKIWHKGCFKCQECGMTLSMKTYKGFNKLPYCEAHIPKAKATAVAETPELKRLAENTKIQSNVRYHAEFEKNKAKFTQVADDPEMLRIQAHTKVVSNVLYHGDLEKKAQMEKKRVEPESTETSNYLANSGANEMNAANANINNASMWNAPNSSYDKALPCHGSYNHAPQGTIAPVQTQNYYSASKPADGKLQSHPSSASYHPGGGGHTYQPPPQYCSQHPGNRGYAANPSQHNHLYGGSLPQMQQYQQPPQMHPGVYSDANQNSPYSARNSQTLIYSSQTGAVPQQPVRSVGSIADYDPMNERYGSISQNRNVGPRGEKYPQRTNLYGDQGYQQPHGNPGGHHKVTSPPTQLGRCFRAMYDYEAADTDEVTFKDGDIILNCTSIDEGWMTGTVQRTGRSGMLPANYVERVS